MKYYKNFSELPLYLTTEQVALLLQLSVDSVQRYLASGILIGFKVGKEWRIDRDDLIDFLNKSKKKQ